MLFPVLLLIRPSNFTWLESERGIRRLATSSQTPNDLVWIDCSSLTLRQLGTCTCCGRSSRRCRWLPCHSTWAVYWIQGTSWWTPACLSAPLKRPASAQFWWASGYRLLAQSGSSKLAFGCPQHSGTRLCFSQIWPAFYRECFRDIPWTASGIGYVQQLPASYQWDTVPRVMHQLGTLEHCVALPSLPFVWQRHCTSSLYPELWCESVLPEVCFPIFSCACYSVSGATHSMQMKVVHLPPHSYSSLHT